MTILELKDAFLQAWPDAPESALEAFDIANVAVTPATRHTYADRFANFRICLEPLGYDPATEDINPDVRAACIVICGQVAELLA